MNYDFTELDKAVRSWHRHSPVIKISQFKLSTGYQIAIYADINEHNTNLDYRDLEKYLNWASDQLKEWPNVVKTGYNNWIFSNLRDAEKFTTLFLLYKSVS